MRPYKLKGNKVMLSPPDHSDTEQYCRWLNDAEIGIYLRTLASVITLKQEAEHIDMLTDKTSGNYTFAIVDVETGELLGNCGLAHTNMVDRTSELGIFIGPKEKRSQGAATEAIQLLLDFGFNALNLHNIWLGTYAYNKAGQALFKKCGFKMVGKRRQARLVGNDKYDVFFMDIISDEFTHSKIKNIIK